MRKIIEQLNRTVLCTEVSNASRNGGVYGNATVIVAYAVLVHEVRPVVLAVLQALGHG